MSIDYTRPVGLEPSLTWEEVYQAFKERLLADLQGRYELVEIHTWNDPPLEVCESCGMHPKSHLDGCPVAVGELDGVLTTVSVEILTRVPLQPTADPEICPSCNMHDKRHTFDCPVAGLAVVQGIECTACGHLFHKGPCPEPSRCCETCGRGTDNHRHGCPDQ